MCLTCGCKLPHEDHGKNEYLTIEDLERSAAVDSYSLDEAVKRRWWPRWTWPRGKPSTSTGKAGRWRRTRSTTGLPGSTPG